MKVLTLKNDNHAVHQLKFVLPRRFGKVLLAFLKSLDLPSLEEGKGNLCRNVVGKQTWVGELRDCRFWTMTQRETSLKLWPCFFIYPVQVIFHEGRHRDPDLKEVVRGMLTIREGERWGGTTENVQKIYESRYFATIDLQAVLDQRVRRVYTERETDTNAS